ncbi:TRAP transporter large permease subunit, partial [Microvirga sp. 2TAF3]|uniref:TRAP transporter large permease subunit n=1 Tax=Microvirga sp. 2TAF3 TaxID=3233014 RepID=UPI003F99957F
CPRNQNNKNRPTQQGGFCVGRASHKSTGNAHADGSRLASSTQVPAVVVDADTTALSARKQDTVSRREAHSDPEANAKSSETPFIGEHQTFIRMHAWAVEDGSALHTEPAPGLLEAAPIVAHFFIFYYGGLADITPPVALAAFAGASMAGADPFKTGNKTFGPGLGKALGPFVFVYGPAMLIVTPKFV